MNRETKFLLLLLVGAWCSNSTVSAETRDKFGLTALHYAAQKKEVAALKQLLGEGRDPNVRGSSGWTPLFSAVVVSNKEAVVVLLDAGADVNARADNGNRPLHHAPDVIAPILISRGAKIDAQNEQGWAPLHSAAFFGRSETVRLLLAAGASREAKSADGKTATDLARERNHATVVSLLETKAK